MCSNFCYRYVDDTLNGNNETAISNLKFDLLKAHLSGPGGNTTGADGLTIEAANKSSNVDVASVLMDPLDFYQVREANNFASLCSYSPEDVIYSTMGFRHLYSLSVTCLKRAMALRLLSSSA